MGQEPILYATSVKENIAYGLDCWDMDMVERAAKLANAHEFIMDMKEKYDANTGEKGLQLSGKWNTKWSTTIVPIYLFVQRRFKATVIIFGHSAPLLLVCGQ